MATSILDHAMQEHIDTWKQAKFDVTKLEEADLEEPNFLGLDYLSLSRNQDLRQLVLERLAKHRYILGAGGSRLGGGNSSEHVRLEARLKDFFRGPSALLFNSGFEANIGLWTTLPQKGDVIVYDQYSHASIIDGIRASRAKNLYAFEHNSVEDLQKTLRHILEAQPLIQAGKVNVFVLVESVYSMDGDFAPLTEICNTVEEILPKENAYIYIDEAHSTGVIEQNGRGLAVQLGLQNRIAIRLHTFGKGFGCSGAVVLCSPLMRHFLIYACRASVFSTSGTRCNLIGLECVLDYMESDIGVKLVTKEQALIAHLRKSLSLCLRGVEPNLAHIPDQTKASVDGYLPPLIPLFSERIAGLTEYLTQHGILIKHTGYPIKIVPKGTDRMRVCVQAAMTFEQIDELVHHIRAWIVKEQKKQKMLAKL